MQAQRGRAKDARMVRSLTIATMLAAIASVATAQGRVATAERGLYVCELPGDAAGAASHVQAERNFTIETSSRYSSPQGAGTYLRRGERLQMTSGPRKGEAYQVMHPGFLRLLRQDGKAGRLRCVLQS